MDAPRSAGSRETIDSPEQLEAWLRDQPREVAAAIAVRAALRVLPLVLAAPERRSSRDDKILETLRLQSFRVVFAGWTMAAHANYAQVLNAAANTAAAAALAAAATDAAAAATLAATHTARAAYAAAHAAALAATDAAALAATDAAATDAAATDAAATDAAATDAAADAAATDAAATDAAAAAAITAADAARAAANDDAASWAGIAADIDWLGKSKDRRQLIQQPLWLIDVRGDRKYNVNFPPWIRTPFDEFDQSPSVKQGPWGVWLEWYRSILQTVHGKGPKNPFNAKTAIEVASKDDAFWSRDPDKVTADVANIAGWTWESRPAAKARPAPPRPGNKEQAPSQSPSSGGDQESPVDDSSRASTAPSSARGAQGQGAAETIELGINAQVPFRSDAPSETDDALNRGPLALFLARRLHLIWCEMNDCAPKPRTAAQPNVDASSANRKMGTQRRSPRREPDTFIVHIDAPWGGGKTTFANFVARTLNPRDEKLNERHFLRSVAPTGTGEDDLAMVNLDEIFLLDPSDDPTLVESERGRWNWRASRPWIVARYNAWRDQYVQPPWWHIFLTILGSLDATLKAETNVANLETNSWLRLKIWFAKLRYQLFNSKFRSQLVVIALITIVAFLAWYFGWVSSAFSLDPKTKPIVDNIIAMLAAGGIAIATFLSVLSQSLAPDLDFTAEHKQIGVADPIGRFRKIFEGILDAVDRPVLLIIDDIDRCDPKTVVEVLRGFQTIIRSPRLFVLVLGDRSWIEKAHEIHHKDFASVTVGTENTLGERFVEKIFQLSFTLPAMTPEMRERFARSVLGTSDEATVAAAQATTQRDTSKPNVSPEQKREALSAIERKIDNAKRAGTVGEREKLVDDVERESEADAIASGITKEEVAALASKALVAAAASDAGYQKQLANVLLGLATRLPNNPRQIKRIINAFAVYETVGRLYFDYRLTSGDGGDDRSRRWRQLAMWTTLATEWPQTWRELAREPRYAEAAYNESEAVRSKIRNELLEGEGDEAKKKKIEQFMQRLTADVTLSRLLCIKDDPVPSSANAAAPVGIFANVRIDSGAIYEFNRIMWEPGFPTSPPQLAAPATQPTTPAS